MQLDYRNDVDLFWINSFWKNVFFAFFIFVHEFLATSGFSEINQFCVRHEHIHLMYSVIHCNLLSFEASAAVQPEVLYKAYCAATGIPAIVNTSFNAHGEPIVCSAMDAWKGPRLCSLHVLASRDDFSAVSCPTCHARPETEARSSISPLTFAQ